jgi:tetraacyldisaccharide 4'-kinase
MLAMKAPEIPVIVGADRVEATRQAGALGATVVVLDSGFQHWRLARDLDIVALTWPLKPEEALLPGGRLREPLSALERADLKAWAHHQESPSPHCDPKSFAFSFVPRWLVGTDFRQQGLAAELAGRKVVLITGIARPERVAGTAAGLGASIEEIRCFPDHHPFSASQKRAILQLARRRAADMVVTTEKDLVRLVPWRGAPLVAVRGEIVITAGHHVLSAALSQLGT